MSDMYAFGMEDEQPEPQTQGDPDPKGFRKWMGEVSETLRELRAENDRLRSAQRQSEVAEALKAKGYAPEAAGLYSGKPEGLDDWLSANGAALAKTATAAEGQEQAASQGTPQTVVSPESQAAQAAFSAAGTDGAPALSGEDALVARMNAAKTEEEYAAIMREAGNRFFR